MSALTAITLGDVATALRRYQPVAIAVAALLIVFAVLPEPAHVAGELTDGRSLLDQTRADAPTQAESATPLPSAAPGVAESPAFSPSFDATAGGATSGFASPSSSSSSFSAFPEASSDDAVVSFDGTSIDSDTTTTGAPLRIVGSTWAARMSGTPFAKEGVPEGTLPVSFRVTDDKRSYIRLAGEQKVLRLVEDPGGARATSGPAIVQACAVTSDPWADGEAIPFDGSPAWDAGSCVIGTPGGDGTWTFDLASFPKVDDPRGFALVPGEGAGVDFQVTFKKASA